MSLSFSSTAAKAASAVSDAVFTKSLSTMIKGIRGTKDKNQHEFIAQCLAEIKKELTSTDPDYKTEALKKLIFLQMMGYDMSWAAFHIIEVMSLPWYGHRRVGFLAASLAFNQTTDVILLTTNLLQKAFQQQASSGPMVVQNPKLAEGIQYEVGAAIGCFASIVTPALANDLLHDILALLNNPKPYIRKRGIIALYSIFHKHPPALRLAFDALLDKLTDDNPSVNSSVVYVLCELISKTPKNYLDLAPQFFHILTTSSNNWVLIKVVKIMGYLVPHEPRLAKKLQEPLSSIVTTTPAKSLMYECINTLLCGQITQRAVVRLCLDKLRELVESPDQNLKYLGLLGLNKLIHSFPRIVVQHKDLILNCLNDADTTIRTRALDLVTHLVTPSNLPGVVKKLLQHIHALSEASTHQQTAKGIVQFHSNQYHNTVIAKILELCTQDQYGMIADFEWFFYTLLEFTKIKSITFENVLKIIEIIKDLLLSIPDLRPFAVNQLCVFILGLNNNIDKQQLAANGANYISTCHLLQDIYQYTLLHELQLTETTGHYNTITTTQSKLKKQALQQIHNAKQHQYKLISSNYLESNPMIELLAVVSWGIGEYVEFIHNHALLLQCFLLHPAIPYLSSNVQNSFLYASVKVLGSAFQQPFFTTPAAAQEYEARQHKQFLTAVQQAKELKQNSILPSEFDINDDQNYQQKFGEDEDDEDEDEDDEGSGKVKGGFMALSALGHNIVIGRTFAQHVTFLEQSATTVLSGLNMFLYHTSYPEVQDRAHTFFNYFIWVFSLLGSEFNVNNSVGIAPQAQSPTTSPHGAQEQGKSISAVDLTSLIFKEQQQTTALDTLISTASPTAQGTPDGNDQLSFDPLQVLSNNASLSETIIPVSPLGVGEKEYSPQFIKLIKTHVQYILPLFADELQPVSSKTQKKVPVPNGLDLDECIYDLDLDMKDKPLYDDKTHPLFPTGFLSQNYISSKELDKRDFAPQKATPVVPVKDGTSFSAADFDDSGNVAGAQQDDDDLFMSKDQLNKRKKNRFGGADDDETPRRKGSSTNAAIQQRHQNDPFYIGGTTITKNKKAVTAASLTLDDLDFGGPTEDKKKKMAIKKTATKAIVDDDDGFGGDDLLGDLIGGKKAPTKKVVKKTKKEAKTQEPEAEPVTMAKKAVKKKKVAPQQDVDNLLDQVPQTQTPVIPPSPSNNAPAPFNPPDGTIVLYKTANISVYARARPFINSNMDTSAAIAQPIILVAVTIAVNPDAQVDNNTISMFQLSIHGNKHTQVQQSPVPQPSSLVQVIQPPSNKAIVHVQAKNIAPQQSVTGYFAVQWNSNNISTSSRYFNFDLKLIYNGELLQYVDPATNNNILTLPTSVFIQPSKISMVDVQAILTNPTSSCTTVSSYIATCTSQQQIMSILKGIEVALNVALIEAANKTAVYYGRCITLQPEQSDICVYVKCTDDLRVHITIKTSAQVLSDKLQQDVVTLLNLDSDDNTE